MNCAQANKIPIKVVLESFSISPDRENYRCAFYFALDREEKTASLSVDFVKNKAFDFGSGKSYDVVSIIQTIKKCSVSEALKYLERFNFSFEMQNQQFLNLSKTYAILEVKEIQHPALLQYLKSRKVETQKHLVSEIHYQMNDKKYFGVGFKNDSDGYEVRNAYSKICLGKKDITTIKNNSKSLLVFEGFFDFLSFKNIEKSLENKTSDYMILNSVSMINKIKNSLENYEKIEIYFDNDEAGNRAVELIKNEKNEAEDCRVLYSDFKDLNEWLVNSTKFEEKLGGSLVQKVPKVYNKRGR